MASPQHNDDPEAVEIDLPFLSLRLGRPWGWRSRMNGDHEYRRVRRRVRARLSFYRHLATYVAVMGAVLLVDWLTGGGISDALLWVAGIWGAFVVLQGANAVVFAELWGREAEERMIERELRRRESR